MTLHRFSSFAVALVFCIGTAPAAFAAQEGYECTISKRSARGPVPKTITLRVDPSKFRASVQDEFTKQIFRKPVPAKYEAINTRKFKVQWQLVGLNYKGSETRVTSGIVDYELTLQKPELSVKLSGNSREYISRIYGEGRCVRLK